MPGAFPWWQWGHVHALEWRGTFSVGWRVPIMRRVIWTRTCAQKQRISNVYWIIIPHFWRQPHKFTNCPHCLAHSLKLKLCKASPLSRFLVKKLKVKQILKMMGKKSVADGKDVKCSFQYFKDNHTFIHFCFVFLGILQLCLVPYGAAFSKTTANISFQTLQLERYQHRKRLLLALINLLKKNPMTCDLVIQRWQNCLGTSGLYKNTTENQGLRLQSLLFNKTAV